MKRILTIGLLGYLVISFTGCGDAHFEDATQLITVIDCNDSSVGVIPDDYTTMLSGDVLVNDVTPTTISTFHDAAGNKKVCTQSGKAHLIRN